jgi:hypothetical protein
LDFVVLYVDPERLPQAEYDAFVTEAEALGFDVDELTPTMSLDPGSVVLMSSAIGAMLGTLAESAGESAGDRLWALLKRVLRVRGRQSDEAAIADRTTRVTFVFDASAVDAGKVAAREMCALAPTISAIPDGTVLGWNPSRRKWQAHAR